MTEYKPKVRRRGIQIPFGYFLSPFDPYILLPDPKKLDALHYAYRMKAKYRTSYRDCTQWLHAATGQRMSPSGFMQAYKLWVKRLRKENLKAIKAKKDAIFKEKQTYIDENLKNLNLVMIDADDISALAEGEAIKQIQKR